MKARLQTVLDNLNYQFSAWQFNCCPLFVLGVALYSCSKQRSWLTAGLLLHRFAKVTSGKALSNLAFAVNNLVKKEEKALGGLRIS